MKRLQKLKIEKALAGYLSLLPFQMKPLIKEYYDREIKAIEEYGSSNPDVSDCSLLDLKNFISAMLEGLHDGDQEAK